MHIKIGKCKYYNLVREKANVFTPSCGKVCETLEASVAYKCAKDYGVYNTQLSTEQYGSLYALARAKCESPLLGKVLQLNIQPYKRVAKYTLCDMTSTFQCVLCTITFSLSLLPVLFLFSKNLYNPCLFASKAE